MLIKRIQHTNPLDKCLTNLSKYQYLVIAFLCLSKIPMFAHIVLTTFMNPKWFHYHCDVNGEMIKNYCPCPDPKWNTSVLTKTMQNKFNLKCETDFYNNIVGTVGFAGMLVGALFFGFLSDKFGRCFAFSISCALISGAALLMAKMTSIVPFITLRFVESFGTGGGIVTAYVYVIEYVSTEYREIVTAVFHIPLNFGQFAIAVTSYVFRDMDDLIIAISIPMGVFAFTMLLLHESPRWLMDNNKMARLAPLLKKLCPKSTGAESEIRRYAARRAGGEQKLKFFKIFKFKYLTVNFLCMAFNYFLCGFAYYGVTRFIGDMSPNIHYNVAISGLVLIPGTCLCIVLLGILSRKYFLMLTNIVAGVFIIIVVLLIPEKDPMRLPVVCISSTAFFMSFIIVFLYGVELFPTSVRNSVLGVLSMLSRIGSLFVDPVARQPEPWNGLVFGGCAIIGAILCIPLPDTRDLELPGSLEQAEEMMKIKKDPKAARPKTWGETLFWWLPF